MWTMSVLIRPLPILLCSAKKLAAVRHWRCVLESVAQTARPRSSNNESFRDVPNLDWVVTCQSYQSPASGGISKCSSMSCSALIRHVNITVPSVLCLPCHAQAFWSCQTRGLNEVNCLAHQANIYLIPACTIHTKKKRHKSIGQHAALH